MRPPAPFSSLHRPTAACPADHASAGYPAPFDSDDDDDCPDLAPAASLPGYVPTDADRVACRGTSTTGDDVKDRFEKATNGIISRFLKEAWS